ncbi:MAG TPA: nitrite reductase (NAD(P)H) small subunit [Candidatus Dormibacteraeota bacterium]|jgi:nitrite reductase (NADH) small subunit|nr:nitrite reductase (NAD(P)H) small subunit [Candidatus Dormibacteraeota bacterium]
MSMATLHRAGLLSSLHEGVGQVVEIDGKEIALFRTGDRVFAIGARCPHAGGFLADGMVCGDVVVCPLHVRRVHLKTGEVEDWEVGVKTYSVVVREGEILLEL